MVVLKDKTQKRRAPGPKTKRSVIPEKFTISRTAHPLRQMLDEAQGTSGLPQVLLSGKPETDMASMQAIPSTTMASMQAIPSTTGKPETKPSGLPAVELYGKPDIQTKTAKYRRANEATCTTRIDADLLRKIKGYCGEKGVSIQEFWTVLASHYFEHMASMQAIFGVQPMASMLAHDDMMISQTHDDIIMRYERYTNQKWTRRDDREGQKYNSVDIKLIEIAVILTIERKLRGNTARQPIKSFNYFTLEINTVMQQQKDGALPMDIGQYHKYCLDTWEKRIRPSRDEKWGLKN